MNEQPTIRVVRGQPTAEELAALTAVLLATAGRHPPPRPTRSRWTDLPPRWPAEAGSS